MNDKHVPKQINLNKKVNIRGNAVPPPTFKIPAPKKKPTSQQQPRANGK